MKPSILLNYGLFALFMLGESRGYALASYRPNFTLDKSEGIVSVTGTTPAGGAMVGPAIFYWGDGQSVTGYFPQTHTYSDKTKNYTITLELNFSEGGPATATGRVFFVDPLVTVQGSHVKFVNFPESFFGSQMSPQEVVRLVDIQYSLLRGMHPNYDGAPIDFAYSGDNCGAFSIWYAHTITICANFHPDNTGGVLPWDVFAHEMSHNLFPNANPFITSSLSTYSAYMDEHQAEVAPAYVLKRMIDQAGVYGLSSHEVSELSERDNVNRTIQANAYAQYAANGKPFIIEQSQVVPATLTGQATSGRMLALMGVNNSVIETFGVKWNQGKDAFSGAIPSTIQLANFVAAAWSASFGTDLRSTFRNDLNYPIDDALFAQYAALMGLVPRQAAYISQEVPGAMTAGQNYPVAITMKNTGSMAWTEAAEFRLGPQGPSENRIWGIARVQLGPGETIARGQTKKFSFTIKAPPTAGTYNFQWQMVQEFVAWFGDLSPATAVTVTINPQPPQPDLSGLNGRTFTLQDEVSLPYTGQATGFNWELTPISNGSQAAADSIQAAGGPQVIATLSPRMSFSQFQVSPARYILRVQAVSDSQTSNWSAATVTLVSAELNHIRVYPSPWRADLHGSKPITFDTLTSNCAVKIFTLTGEWVRTLSAPSGSVTWDLKNNRGDDAASGLYIYRITDDHGGQSRGKFTIIR